MARLLRRKEVGGAEPNVKATFLSGHPVETHAPCLSLSRAAEFRRMERPAPTAAVSAAVRARHASSGERLKCNFPALEEAAGSGSRAPSAPRTGRGIARLAKRQAFGYSGRGLAPGSRGASVSIIPAA